MGAKLTTTLRVENVCGEEVTFEIDWGNGREVSRVSIASMTTRDISGQPKSDTVPVSIILNTTKAILKFTLGLQDLRNDITNVRVISSAVDDGKKFQAMVNGKNRGQFSWIERPKQHQPPRPAPLPRPTPTLVQINPRLSNAEVRKVLPRLPVPLNKAQISDRYDFNFDVESTILRDAGYVVSFDSLNSGGDDRAGSPVPSSSWMGKSE